MAFCINWQWKNFRELSNEELYEILKLRSAIFIVEQNCDFQDTDGVDKYAVHQLGFVADKLVAYCRIFPPNIITEQDCSLGRVSVQKKYRHRDIGRVLVERAVHFLKTNWPKGTTRIQAEYYLNSFYRSLGFQPCSDIYEDFRILHVNMTLKHEDAIFTNGQSLI